MGGFEKPMAEQTLQERLITDFSSHLLGAQSVFKPELYRNGEEPADLVWVVGRCVVILHMTSSKRSLDYNRNHNHAQLHKWLRRWKQGAILRGIDIALDYDDVDFVIGISVVGGPNAASVIEDREVLVARCKGHEKLFACATITDIVLQRLAKRSVGLKDIIQFFDFLRARGDEVSDSDSILWIEFWEDHFAAQARLQFSDSLPDTMSLNQSWLETHRLFAALKSSDSQDYSASVILSDICFADAVWLSVAERAAVSSIEKPNNRISRSVIWARRRVGTYSIGIVAGGSSELARSDFNFAIANALTIVSILEPGFRSKMFVSKATDAMRTLYPTITRFAQELSHQ